MPRPRLAGLVGVALVAGAAACVPPPPPEPAPPPPPCRDTPTGGETIGDERYLEPVFADVAVACDIPYGEAPDENGVVQTLKMDLYAPVGDTATNRPVLLWLMHGGFFISGKDAAPHPEYASRLARRGYVVAVVEYRIREMAWANYHDEPFDPDLLDAATDAQHDAQAAVRWFRRVAEPLALGIDTSRIATIGISAGGMTALAVNYDEGDVGTSGNPNSSSDVAAAISLEGCALDRGVIDADDGPVLLIHATDDAVVLHDCAVATRDTAQGLGLFADLESYPGPAGHGFTFDVRLVIDDIVQFLFDELVN